MSHKAEHKMMNIIHLVQVVVIGAVLGISAYRMLILKIRTSRNDSMVMGVAAKGLILMAYMIYTEKTYALKRFASAKANMILAFTEIVFWAAGAILPIMSVSSCSPGTGCMLTYILIGLAIVNCLLSLVVAKVSWSHWRYFQAHGYLPGYVKPDQLKDDISLKGRPEAV
ncbi:hypothetical protein BJ875DRAFT_482647 [Amylocarpus encephaloides]|uniref:MARVEL domain-containing protein n=1 Tax=Amylocarpus encephaloides TaxID=45428 RepID=A0A9P8C765_9HELO|nr:hypothetical protein BJ875DRAFT_482647 [Amylocarpus encephaloides]